MADQDEQQQQPPAAAKPGAAENLDKLLQEEQGRDQHDESLVEEIQGDEAAQIRARKEAAAREKAAEAGAAMAIGFVGQVLAMIDPAAKLMPEEVDALTGTLAPVMLKNNGEPPAWLAEYREEFNFFMTGVGVGVGVYLRVSHAKAERKKQEDAARAAGATS